MFDFPLSFVGLASQTFLPAGNEPYFFDVGNIALGDDPNGTTLRDLHDFSKHGPDNISAWTAWLNEGSCKFANVKHGAQQPEASLDNVLGSRLLVAQGLTVSGVLLCIRPAAADGRRGAL